jgi:hypothetical protein
MTRVLVLRPSPIELFRAAEGRSFVGRIYSDKTYSRVRAGVYAATGAWDRLKPWDRYLARVHAYALVRPDAAFAFESAAVLRGLPIFGEPRDIHIFDTHRRRSLRFGDVAVHTSEDARHIDEIGALRLTTAAHTVVDLARVLPPAFGLAVVDAALRHGHIPSLDEVVVLARSQRTTRGRTKLEWVWPRADARAESVGESVSRAVAEWWGFPTPELQRTFRAEGAEDRVDFFWAKARVIGESDGYAKYEAETAEDAVARVIAEKQREDRLRRQANGFARWDWKDTMSGTGQRDKLVSAGLQPESPPKHALLATLRHHPRSLQPKHPPRAEKR